MKILIIDDSTLSRNMLKRALGEDHEYLEAADGMSGIEKYYLERPALVVLDLTMPGINGLEVLKKLREIDPEVKILIGTADVQTESRRLAIEYGASGFVSKPFTAETVQAELKDALGDD
jgi:two-component system, chemotaxis family, chemotaxis protein CheY